MATGGDWCGVTVPIAAPPCAPRKHTNLMKGACWGRMKTNRQTPTSCSEASSTYLWSREMVFWSSTAQSFWFVVL